MRAARELRDRVATLPVLRQPDLGAPLALDARERVTAGRFLGETRALAERLPAATHVVNLCADRYRFTVGFVAALLRGQVTLLPSSEAAAPLLALRETYPGLYFLGDGAVTASEPAFTYPPDLSGAPGGEIPAIPADQPAAILFTSGSTGAPMPHPRRWGAMVHSAQAAGRAIGLDEGAAGFILGTVPHQHSYGLESIVMLALQHGLAFHRTRPLLPGDIRTQLEALPEPRILVTTPIHLRSLVAQEGALPRLARIVCATAPLAVDLARAAEERFGAPLSEIYGCSEIGQMAVRRTVETAEWRCLDGIRLSQRGGEVWASGEAAAVEAPINDNVQLRDAARFVLKDRKSDLVNIAGKRSSLAYLNHHLTAIPGVEDGVFVAPEEGGRLTAYVVAPALSAAEILAALRRQIDPAFLPRPLHKVDALPRNATGKLTRQSIATLAGSADGWRSAEYRFPPDHAAGHFPGNPIVPGAALLDRVLRAIGGHCGAVKVAKFHRPIRPGEAITIRWRATDRRETAFECRLSDGGEIALSGTVSAPA